MTGQEMRKIRRTTFDKNQQEFGDLIGYSKDYVSKVERTNAELSNKMLIAIEEKLKELQP